MVHAPEEPGFYTVDGRLVVWYWNIGTQVVLAPPKNLSNLERVRSLRSANSLQRSEQGRKRVIVDGFRKCIVVREKGEA